MPNVDAYYHQFTCYKCGQFHSTVDPNLPKEITCSQCNTVYLVSNNVEHNGIVAEEAV
jgi:hypothetical protein